MKVTREDSELAKALPSMLREHAAGSPETIEDNLARFFYEIGQEHDEEREAARVEGAAAALADPERVLNAAEEILREAGTVRVLLCGPPDDSGPFVELGDATHADGDSVSVTTDTLYEGWAWWKEEARRG